MEKKILVSIDDERLKYISEILGNKTCKKILNLLSDHELTETEIAKELKIPLNTVGYNIKKLVQSGLVDNKSHWWSVKGKKMPTYQISNKTIVISPKKSKSQLTKNFVLTIIVTGIVSLIIKTKKILPSQKSSEFLLSESLSRTPEIVSSASPIAESYWIWFLLGAVFALAVFILLNFISEHKNV
ncbi:MAG: ArsR/SmtB family transcription factor [Nanoarchaeota archaeon]